MGYPMTPDVDALRQKLLDDHDAFVDAHVNNKPDLLVENLADDYVNVSRSDLLRQTKDEILTTFSEYRVMGPRRAGSPGMRPSPGRSSG
jgi:hypothetical protein